MKHNATTEKEVEMKSQQSDREDYSSAFKTVNEHNQCTGSDEVVFLIKLQNNENNHPKKRKRE